MKRHLIRSVAMLLVCVSILGVAVMPFQAMAAQWQPVLYRAFKDPVISAVVYATEVMAIDMLTSTTTSELEAAASRFSAFFEPDLQTNLLYLTADQMNDLSGWLVQNGIQVQPKYVPGRDLLALALKDDYVTTSTGTVRLDASVGDYYTYDGYTIVRIAGGSAAEEDRDSFTVTSSTSSQVGVTPEGGLTTFDEQTKNTGITVNGPTINHNTTTNNWQVKNELGTYVDADAIFYNPITQTYDVTIDNRSYTYQFYYEYTYITYIGSSAEYREAYKVYYELPDGRSSGDLTIDELKGLSLQFDMVNYDKAASDTMTQALFDFDGNLDNSAYYNASANWITGSSIEYLEAPEGFGGCLYYPSDLVSRLDFNLASVLEKRKDYTLQFRIYLNGVCAQPIYITANGTPDWMNAFEVEDDWGEYYTRYINASLWNLSSSYSYSNNAIPLIRFQNNKISYFSLKNNAGQAGSFIDCALFAEGQWYDICISSDPFLYQSDSNPQGINYLWIYVNGVRVASINTGTSGGNYNYDSGFDNRQAVVYGFSPAGHVLGWQRISNYTGGGNNQIVWGTTSMARLSGFSIITPTAGGNSCLIDNLRVVSHALYTGVQSFNPSPVPFSPNLVYVLPSVADLNDNTVAIMSQLPVSGYRVGGVRPTDPTLPAGYVYMHIDGEFVDSVQQYNGSYWEEVTARLYTGIRWIPVTAFNVYTLEDMFDIIDPDADGGGDTVNSIYQYYLWWSGEWGTFQQWLQGTMQTLIDAIQNSGGSGSGPVVIVPGLNDQTQTNEITTQNPDGSTTVTTIVSNAAGLVYSRSVTTYPADSQGNVTTITVYTDSTGVMYQTTTVTDPEGNVTVTEPSEAKGSLASILAAITQGVFSVATTVLEGFISLVVELVQFVLSVVGTIFSGVGTILGALVSAITSFTAEIGAAAGFLPALFSIFPAPIQAGFTLIFVGGVAIGLFRLIHF